MVSVATSLINGILNRLHRESILRNSDNKNRSEFATKRLLLQLCLILLFIMDI